MPKDFDKLQKVNEKSPEDGLKDQTHNEHEHGLGAKQSPDDPRDFKFENLMVKEGIASAIDFPSRYVIPNRPPIRNQGTSPMCVAYSSGYDQSHMDRREYGSYFDPWESKFFEQIGGGPDGAFMRNALDQRKGLGYPVQNVGHKGAHRISSYYRVPLGIDAVKTALTIHPINGGVLILGPWYHSWYHTFTSGKLPYPDYYVGGHAWWAIGWDDNYGILAQNSWGPDYGKNGLFYMPYSYISRMWEVWRTFDR